MGMRGSRFGSVVFVVISLLAALCYNPQLYATGVSPLAAVPVLLLHLALAVTFGVFPDFAGDISSFSTLRGVPSPISTHCSTCR